MTAGFVFSSVSSDKKTMPQMKPIIGLCMCFIQLSQYLGGWTRKKI